MQKPSSEIQKVIAAHCKQAGVDQKLALAICSIESSFNPNAHNLTSGAAGLFQIESGALRDVLSTYGGTKPSDLFDVASNSRIGVYYIKKCASYVGVNPTVDNAVAIYATFNLGIGNYRKLISGETTDRGLLAAFGGQADSLKVGGISSYLANVRREIDVRIAALG